MKPSSSGRVMLSVVLGTLALFGLLWGGARPTPAWANSCPQELIQRVNALRAQHGLPPYQPNAILMAVAQAHSEYQASIGQGTHIGPNGDHPRDRVRAAGYGGGATVFVSENIAWGTSSYVSPAWAVQVWTQDAPHLNTMLGENYRDVGAGCANGGGKTYFTLDAAYYIGEPQPTSGGSGVAPTPVPLPPTAEPVIVSTPNADGAVIHVVGHGQTLLQIALAYGVPLEEILRLNGLTENSLIYPGQKILIRVGTTPTPTLAPTPTGEPSPTPASSASPTASLTAAAPTAISTATRTPAPTPGANADAPGRPLLLWGLAGALLAGALAYGLMALLARLEGE